MIDVFINLLFGKKLKVVIKGKGIAKNRFVSQKYGFF